jgi:hypothetical protein
LPDGRVYIINRPAHLDKEDDWGVGTFPYDGEIYSWTNGNQSCDCNMILAIERQYGIELNMEAVCGDKIELLSLTVDGRELLHEGD